jgi:NAD(P)-dependent dehydrogenase (short-subunit alcohol dehydrogenase family)
MGVASVNELQGKVALVTGSSRGIGKVLALKLAEAGADIVVCGRTEVEIDLPGTIGETAAAVEKFGVRGLPVRMDLADDESVDDAVAATMAAFGRIDILVNNAVIVGPRLPLLDGSPDFLDTAYRVNVHAPFRLIQRVGSIMRDQGGGTIINITSGSANHAPAPPSQPITEAERDSMDPSYGITKAALNRMTNVYASELLADNIAIVAVAPGLVITERIRKAAIRRNVDFPRAEPPEVIADAVLLLATDGMRFTGQVLTAQSLVGERTGG